MFRAVGSLKICAAKELKPWLEKNVIPAFQESEKSVRINDSDLLFEGSGVLADNLNNNNSSRCDVVIYGSDVSALRAESFDKNKAIYLANSPIVFIGQKEKLAAARKFVGKGENEALSCEDLAKVAAKGRFGRIMEAGQTYRTPKVSTLTVEMSTSNSGQSAYFSCVYSAFDATSAKEIDDALSDKSGEAKEKGLLDFMSTIKFDTDSSGDVKDNFKNAGLGVGSAHLAIATYENYIPELMDAARNANVELEVFYPDIGILSNFPAQVVAKEGTQAYGTAMALLKLAKSKALQSKLPDHGLRPAIAGVPTKEYMPMNIGVGETPRNRADLKKFWEIVGKVEAVKRSGVTKF